MSPNGNKGSRYDIFADSGLQLLLDEDDLKEATFIIFANKQDLPTSLSVEEISTRLKLDELRLSHRGNEILIIGSSAFTGDGLYEGFDLLVDALNRKKSGERPNILKESDPPNAVAQSLR